MNCPPPVAFKGHVVAGQPHILVHPFHQISRPLQFCHVGDDRQAKTFDTKWFSLSCHCRNLSLCLFVWPFASQYCTASTHWRLDLKKLKVLTNGIVVAAGVVVSSWKEYSIGKIGSSCCYPVFANDRIFEVDLLCTLDDDLSPIAVSINLQRTSLVIVV